jgi:hypothetical protein
MGFGAAYRSARALQSPAHELIPRKFTIRKDSAVLPMQGWLGIVRTEYGNIESV